jgi:hypothetical protein
MLVGLFDRLAYNLKLMRVNYNNPLNSIANLFDKPGRIACGFYRKLIVFTQSLAKPGDVPDIISCQSFLALTASIADGKTVAV